MNEASEEGLDHVARGWSLLDANRSDLAVREFRAALSRDPESVGALGGLGAALSNLDRDEEAREAARDAIRVAPEHPVGYSVLATAELGLGRSTAALKAIDRAIALHSDFAPFHATRGNALLNLDRPNEALIAVNRGLALDAECEKCLNVLSVTLAALHRRGEAVAQARRSLRLDPSSPYAHAILGNALLLQGAYTEAQEHFREALRRKPDYTVARRGLLHTLRAKFFFYRLFLRSASGFVLWMSGRTTRVLILVTVIILLRLTRSMFELDVLSLLTLFVFSVMVILCAAKPLGNALLFLNRDGRMLLDRRERSWAWSALAVLVLAIAFGSLSRVLRDDPARSALLFRAAVACCALLIPIGIASLQRPGATWARRVTNVALIPFAAGLAHWVITDMQPIILWTVSLYGVLMFMLLTRRS